MSFPETVSDCVRLVEAFPTDHPYLYAHLVAPLIVGVLIPAAVGAVARFWAHPPVALARVVATLRGLGIDVPRIVSVALADGAEKLPKLGKRPAPRGCARVPAILALGAAGVAIGLGASAVASCGPTSPANAVVDFPTRRKIEAIGCDLATPAAATLDPGVLAVLEVVCTTVLPRYGKPVDGGR